MFPTNSSFESNPSFTSQQPSAMPGVAGAFQGEVAMTAFPTSTGDTVAIDRQMLTQLLKMVQQGTSSSQFHASRSQTTLELPVGQYVGAVFNGQPHGIGILTYNQNDPNTRSEYKGEFKNGLRDGQGILKWKNGKTYTGDWANDQPNGRGELQYPQSDEYDRLQYVGEFLADKRVGQGTLTWRNGKHFTGIWVNDGMFKGTFVLPDENRQYTGTFNPNTGEYNGQGVMTFRDNKGSPSEFKWDGEWNEGQFEKGVKTYKYLFNSVYGQRWEIITYTGTFRNNGNLWDGVKTTSLNPAIQVHYQGGAPLPVWCCCECPGCCCSCCSCIAQ